MRSPDASDGAVRMVPADVLSLLDDYRLRATLRTLTDLSEESGPEEPARAGLIAYDSDRERAIAANAWPDRTAAPWFDDLLSLLDGSGEWSHAER